MPQYRICTLDSGGTNMASYEEICRGDDDARAFAQGILKAGGVAEIWAGARSVDIVFVRLPDCVA